MSYKTLPLAPDIEAIVLAFREAGGLSFDTFDDHLVVRDLYETNCKAAAYELSDTVSVVDRQVKVGNRSYLINDDLPNFDWKITKETSEILGFPVLKAVAFLNDEFNTKILAWYSPKLTYKTGPDKFWGLPGLILSLETSITHSNGNQEEMEYVAVKVGKTNKSTKIPNQGKKVNFAEYKIIQSDFLQKQRKMLGIEKD